MARYILGTRAYTSDDVNIGLIDRLIVDPRTMQLQGFVVRKGVLLERDVVIPAEDVAPADLDDMGGILRLTVSAKETNRLLACQEDAYRRLPDAARQPGVLSPVPISPPARGGEPHPEEGRHARQRIAETHPASAILHTGTKIIGRHGLKIGSMEEVVADEHTGAITELIARRGALDVSEVRIPVPLIEYVTDNAIYVAVDKDGLQQFIDP
jgi:sporulation protein YlmC with PRC-barrel domain